MQVSARCRHRSNACPSTLEPPKALQELETELDFPRPSVQATRPQVHQRKKDQLHKCGSTFPANSERSPCARPQIRLGSVRRTRPAGGDSPTHCCRRRHDGSEQAQHTLQFPHLTGQQPRLRPTGWLPRLARSLHLADSVAKVFFGWRRKFLRTADAFCAWGREGPHWFTQKRPRPPYPSYRALQRRRRQKIGFREIISVVRF